MIRKYALELPSSKSASSPEPAPTTVLTASSIFCAVNAPPRDTDVPARVIALFASLAVAIEPASIVLVTEPVSPVVTTVPETSGKVNVLSADRVVGDRIASQFPVPPARPRSSIPSCVAA
mgnify:CR=1 FL=1